MLARAFRLGQDTIADLRWMCQSHVASFAKRSISHCIIVRDSSYNIATAWRQVGCFSFSRFRYEVARISLFKKMRNAVSRLNGSVQEHYSGLLANCSVKEIMQLPLGFKHRGTATMEYHIRNATSRRNRFHQTLKMLGGAELFQLGL